ncbi:MAG: Bifunctional purine biosynthesis protein PurH [Alphaproteobacteria bacterium MarineAlpha5_Bin5]|nr:MAG: Bifunctional purine biosynthesis protein PurH [Alphaproteobacteria bacterium MarineAlpha5_Bin5]PPR50627.1 MAG: Bifunctional purine biosynthesis protein PurH [Alphaproteobacteria bacterium MarineAlpha5_Bin4]|tara:strand:+ start:4059 stop:5579 length:1521 start_codon:yes stop_codon:yes gene_type:complete
MVIRSNVKKYALISVFDKSKLKFLCENLNKQNIGFISTGSTFKKIRSLGFDCKEVSKLINFKEILEGRVKTLHPKIHASLLFKRNVKSHISSFKKLKFPQINYVIVNLYPFKNTLKKTSNYNKIIEMIDVGGTAMLRSAAKNFVSVTAVYSPKDYNQLINNLNKNGGNTSLKFRKKMAAKIYEHTSKYDNLIANWLSKKNTKNKERKINLKYGENPNQSSYFIAKNNNTIFDCKISGKKLGYNNILDVNEGLCCLGEFKEPTCIIIKHNNPCGVASSTDIKKSFINAYNSDTMSSFGGIVLFNRKIKKDLAIILQKKFFEIIVAPNFEKSSLSILRSRSKLILIESKKLQSQQSNEFKSVNSGVLYQTHNNTKINKKSMNLVSKKIPSKSIIEDLIFAFKVAKHVKSNAIVLAKNKQTLGIGAGQMNRLDATKIALMKLNKSFPAKKFVCASDAFFPFTDSIKLLKKNNCDAIIQPNGSINDLKIISYANKNNISLFFSKNRVFKH